MRISDWSSDVCSSDLIPAEFREAIGNRIYGCDDCLAVCPWNKFADSGARDPAFDPRAELAAPELADLLALDDAGFREILSGSPIMRTADSQVHPPAQASPRSAQIGRAHV